MKSEKPDRTIEEIFQNAFKDFEQTPSKGFWPRFEKKLRTKEFLRFNSGRFNIYYLGAVVAATAISLAVLLKDKSVEPAPDNIVNDLTESLTKPDQSISSTTQKTRKVSKGSADASQRVSTIKKEEISEVKTEPGNVRRKEVIESLEIDNSGLERDLTVIEKDKLNRDDLIRPAPAAGFRVDNVSGCVPLKVSFENLSMNYDSCMWEFGDGGYSIESEPVWIFDEDGEFNVKLVVFGDGNQTASTMTTVVVHPRPVARFEVNTGDPMLPDEQVMFYNYSENSVKWLWEFGDGEISYDYEPGHQYSKFDSYSVKLLAISEFGCVDSLIITDAFGKNSCYLKFPNAFIPNDGGPTGGYYSSRTDIESEVFHPVWSGVTEYNLRIFSRSGIMLFETNDINIGWDGYHKGQKVEPGVYIWKVRGVFKNGDPFVQGGDLTLLPKR